MTAAGPRVVLYGAADCSLCGPAKATVAEVAARFGLPVEEVDIGGDAELEAAYRESIPVLELDGRRVARYFVDPDELVLRLTKLGATERE